MTPPASYRCMCGALDEVREPAPPTVDCWKCGKALAMERWHPRLPPPAHAGRTPTPAEAARAQPPRTTLF